MLVRKRLWQVAALTLIASAWLLGYPALGHPPSGAVCTDAECRVDILIGSYNPGTPDYSPDEIRIRRANPGATPSAVTVVWENHDTGVTHTATHATSCPDDQFTPCTAGPAFDSGFLDSGQTFRHAFSVTSGDFLYYCRIHPWMRAKVIIDPTLPPIPEFPYGSLALTLGLVLAGLVMMAGRTWLRATLR